MPTAAGSSALSYLPVRPLDLTRDYLIKRGVWGPLVVEADVTGELTLQGSRAALAPQVDFLVLQRPPQLLHPLAAVELRALIGIGDHRLPVSRAASSSFYAGAGVEGGRQAPRDNIATEPVELSVANKSVRS